MRRAWAVFGRLAVALGFVLGAIGYPLGALVFLCACGLAVRLEARS